MLGKSCFLWLTILCLCLGIGEGIAQEQPRYGGTVNVGIHSDLYGINPFVRMRSIDRSLRSIAYEPLIGMDAKFQVRAFLAESWKISSDSKEYTFQLRRGVRFHNGQEMTAEDVKWSAEYIQDSRHGASGKPLLDDVDKVRALDRYTIQFALKRPSAAFLASLASLTTFFVVPKDSIPMGQTQVQAMPPGTGPFAFREWRAGSHATFERFKDYWQKGLPYLDRVVYKPVADNAARLAALRAGDLHLITRVPSAWVLRVQKGEVRDFHLVASRYAGFRRIYLNVVAPPFNNLKLRQALSYALDRKTILEGAHWGIGEVASQRFPKDSPWHFDIPSRERDLSRVKALLKEAGYKGEKISMVARQGQEEISFIVPQLQEAGFNVAVEMLEAGTYRTRGRTGEFDMTLGGGEIWEDPDPASAEFSCDEAAVKQRKRDNNRTGYCNKEVDALFILANSVADYKKRHELYRKAFATVYDEVPEIHLLFEHRFFGVRPEVRDFVSDSNEQFKWLEGGLHKSWLAR